MTGPFIVVGFATAALHSLEALQPPDSVIFVEEPDVIAKRGLEAKVAGSPVVRQLLAFEYQLPGAADAFVNRFRGLRPVAVIPQVEYAKPFAARLAERYLLPGAGLGAALLLRDKHLLRTVTRAAGIPNPASRLVSTPDEARAFIADHPGRAILKPANRQASVGTRIVDDPASVDAIWAECLVQDEGVYVPDRATPPRMLAEEHVGGDEYSVEMLVEEGRAIFHNVTAKTLYPGERPVECGHAVPADIPAELTTRLAADTQRVIDAVAFRTGIVHCEWIVRDGVPHLVECAGRFAGDGIVELIERAYGVELVRSYYALMCGEQLPAPLPSAATGAAAAWFLRADPGVVTAIEGLDAARDLPGVVSLDVSVGVGDQVAPLRSSWDRVGVAIATAASAGEAAGLAEAAISAVGVVTRSADGEQRCRPTAEIRDTRGRRGG